MLYDVLMNILCCLGMIVFFASLDGGLPKWLLWKWRCSKVVISHYVMPYDKLVVTMGSRWMGEFTWVDGYWCFGGDSLHGKAGLTRREIRKWAVERLWWETVRGEKFDD